MQTEKAIEFVQDYRTKLTTEARAYVNRIANVLAAEGEAAFFKTDSKKLTTVGASMIFWSAIHEDLKRYRTQASLISYGQFYDVPNNYDDRATLLNLFAILFTEEES